MTIDGALTTPALNPAGPTALVNGMNILALGLDSSALDTVHSVFSEVGWTVAGHEKLEDALGYLRRTGASVALAQVDSEQQNWREAATKLRTVPNPPEVIIASSDDVSLEEVLNLGAFDLLRLPLQKYDLLWTVATAWNQWIQKRERHAGGVACFDA